MESVSLDQNRKCRQRKSYSAYFCRVTSLPLADETSRSLAISFCFLSSAHGAVVSQQFINHRSFNYQTLINFKYRFSGFIALRLQEGTGHFNLFSWHLAFLNIFLTKYKCVCSPRGSSRWSEFIYIYQNWQKWSCQWQCQRIQPRSRSEFEGKMGAMSKENDVIAKLLWM